MNKLFSLFYNLLNPIWRLLQFIWRYLKKPLQIFTSFLQIIALLFPAVFFLLASWLCFWKLSQGKDVVIDMLEKKYMGGIILLAVLFFSLVCWYSSRILIYRKDNLFQQNEKLSFHLPRLIGYLGFSVVWIALLKLPSDAYLSFTLPKYFDWVLLLVSFGLYFVLNFFFKALMGTRLNVARNLDEDTPEQLAQKETKEKSVFAKIYLMCGCFVAFVLIINSFSCGTVINAWLFFISVIILQIVFLFIVIIRRGRMPLKNEAKDVVEMPLHYQSIKEWQQAEAKNGNIFTIGIWERILYNANIPEKEKWFFVWYNVITALSLIVYFASIVSYGFSVMLGSFATVLISFGVLVGFFSLITFASVVLKINFHMAIWVLIFIIGKFFESHWVNLSNYKNKNEQPFAARPTLYNYFDNWAAKRKTEIEKDSSYPVFFVLADGGASRSGYWTASVLSKLEDTTNGKFSQHLFCLSGASGGSVGNGTFLALLKYKNQLANSGQNNTNAAQGFLSSDFLTYTLARMLGPDFFRPMIPLPFINDRAAALENAMEQGRPSFLYGKFNNTTAVSNLIPFANGNENLPIICINATRMQDGAPSVISTIAIDSSSFGQRIDILQTLKPGEDMKLSTAVVMGARFPYLSPAGRIGNSYYVDGGYFDNSGAGIVNEMLISLKEYIGKNAIEKPYLNKLKFYVIHAQNGFNDTTKLKKVHPVVNDLAAPLLTLVGAYGTQTSVNDWRLIKYMEGIYQNKMDTGYIPVNLYSTLKNAKKSNEGFPMNWVISNYYINKMNTQLNNVDMQNLIAWINKKLKQ